MKECAIARCALTACALALCTIVTCTLPPAVAAQLPRATDISDSPRLWRWNPLRPIADLGMPGPRLPELPRSIEWPEPRAGLPTIGENPAALPDAIDSAWTQLVLSSEGVAGPYRRPLDPGTVHANGISLAGWRRIGTRTAAIGRVAVEHERLGTGGYSAFVAPYGSSPFVPADTNRPPLDRTIVTFEEAEGTSLGDWHLGIAVGYRAQEGSSSHATAAQVGRASSAGLTLGVDHALGSRARVGVYGRGLQSSESVTLVADPQTVRVYVLDGFVNVSPADFNVALPPFLRREDRSASAWGTNLLGTALGVSWTAHAEHQAMATHQFSSVLAAHPPTDRWHTRGYAIGGSAQATVHGLLAAMSADWQTQHGDADRAVASAEEYHASGSRLSLVAELRTAPRVSDWSFATLLSLGRDAWSATDAAARISTDITAWRPTVSGEVARRLNARWSIAVAGGRAQYTPYANVPSPAGRGAAYTLLLAPAIEVAAATAHADALAFTALRRTATGTMTLRVWTSSTRAARPADVAVPLPGGSRTAWGLSMSLEPARRSTCCS